MTIEKTRAAQHGRLQGPDLERKRLSKRRKKKKDGHDEQDGKRGGAG
jgi:hypothetical protein